MTKTMKRIGIFLGCVLALLALCFVYVAIDNTNIWASHYEINATNLPKDFKGYKIALITDFHNSYFAEKVAQRLLKEQPDVILFGGDMVLLDDGQFDNTVRLANLAKEIAPIYMVSGNHEAFSPKFTKMMDYFSSLGVTVIDDKQVTLKKGESQISLYGMRDPACGDGELLNSPYVENFIQKSQNIDKGSFNILLTHRANLFPQLYAAGFDLVLSGHIHGGLVRLPFVGGLVSPYDEWLPEFTKGLYFRGQSKMVVSPGCDFNLRKPRVFNGPQVTMITLNN